MRDRPLLCIFISAKLDLEIHDFNSKTLKDLEEVGYTPFTFFQSSPSPIKILKEKMGWGMGKNCCNKMTE